MNDAVQWIRFAGDAVQTVMGWVKAWQERGMKVEEARTHLLHLDARVRQVDADVDALLKPQPGDGE